MRISSKAAILLLATIIIGGVQTAQARPKAKADDLVNYSIVHAIPLGFGADIVDVYANNVMVFDNAIPGGIKNLTAVRGNLTVSFYANGVVPGPTTTPLLSAGPVYISNGNNISYVANLTTDEKPRVSIFKNMLTEAGSKRSWLSIRHVAAAPELQVRANGYPLFAPLGNGIERKKTFNFGNYSIDALYSGPNTTAINPLAVSLQKSTNVVLYVWGAKSKGNLAFLKHEIPSRK